MSSLKTARWILLLALLGVSSAPALNGATFVVRMREIGATFFFDPTNLTINLGDTVKWTNTVSHQHDTTHASQDEPPVWHSPLLSGTLPNNSFSFTFTNPGVYPYLCSAHYYGGHTEETGMVAVIAPNLPPTVTLRNPTNNQHFFAPASFTVLADAADSDGSVTQVQFFRGSFLLGTSTNNPSSNTVTGLAEGDYDLLAVAMDNQGARATSSVARVSVITPPAITLTIVERLPDGRLHLHAGIGNSGEMCVIDGCETPPNWTPIYTNIFPNTDCAFCPFIDFTETATNLNRRFYRARVFP